MQLALLLHFHALKSFFQRNELIHASYIKVHIKIGKTHFLEIEYRESVTLPSLDSNLVFDPSLLFSRIKRKKMATREEELQKKREEAERKARRGEIDPTHEFTFQVRGFVPGLHKSPAPLCLHFVLRN